MRELEDCRAEVFRRSEERLQKARQLRRRSRTWCMILVFVLIVGISAGLPRLYSVGEDKGGQPGEADKDIFCEGVGDYDGAAGSEKRDEWDTFSFSLTWNCYGISSYDSATGRLIKTTDTTHPEDYITQYHLTDAQKQRIYDLLLNLNVMAYPDLYNPHKNGLASEPSMTLILSVRTDRGEKTIAAREIALTYEADNPAGQRFLQVCKEIRDILVETDAWKALPEYEFFYD